MSQDILLDTSVIIAHLRGKFDIRPFTPKGVRLFASMFTIGELEKGINKAAHPEKERVKTEHLLEGIALILPDNATAAIYGEVTAKLEKAGCRIPENDAWIASVALECDMELATGDAHFERVEGLKVLKLTW